MNNLRAARLTSGLYATGKLLYIYTDRMPLPTGLKMVQWCHGWPGAANMFAPATITGKILDLMLQNGYLPFSADQGGTNLFGSAAVPTDIEAANTWMAAKFGCRTDKFGMLGYSMGFLNAASEIYANPTKVPVVVGIAPFLDGVGVYNTFAGGHQARIDMDAAAGGTWTTVDAARSPTQRPSDFTGRHVECWVGTSDPTTTPAMTSAFCTAVGGVYHEVAGDHGTVWNSINEADIITALNLGDWS